MYSQTKNALTDAHVAEAALRPGTVLKFGTTLDPQGQKKVTTAIAVTDLFIGVLTNPALTSPVAATFDTAINERVDVQKSGIARVRAGAAIVAGQYLTVNASGQVIPGATGNVVIGQALRDAAANDLVPVQIEIGQL